MLFDNLSLGLWIDDPPRTVLNEGYFRSLVDCNIDTIAIMIDRSDRQWRSTWSEKQIDKVLRLAEDPAIEVVLTTWPYPDKEQIDEMAHGIGKLMYLGPVSAWESDLEFNWKANQVRGFKRAGKKSALDLAGDYFVDKVRETCAVFNARFEMTSFTQHTENGSKADVAPHCDRLLVQAYSVRKRPGMIKKIPWDHTYGPGRMQAFTLDRTLTIPGVEDGKPELGCGLAAWSQRWQDHDPSEAMERALFVAMSYPLIDVRWWSSKHVIGRKRNPYAAKFLESLSKQISQKS